MFSPNGKFFAAFEQNQPNVLVSRAVVILREQEKHSESIAGASH
jgi:hypothetical protein